MTPCGLCANPHQEHACVRGRRALWEAVHVPEPAPWRVKKEESFPYVRLTVKVRRRKR